MWWVCLDKLSKVVQIVFIQLHVSERYLHRFSQFVSYSNLKLTNPYKFGQIAWAWLDSLKPPNFNMLRPDPKPTQHPTLIRIITASEPINKNTLHKAYNININLIQMLMDPITSDYLLNNMSNISQWQHI